MNTTAIKKQYAPQSRSVRNTRGGRRMPHTPKQKTLRSLAAMISILTMTMLILAAWQQPVATYSESYAAAPMASAPQAAAGLNMMSDYLFILALPLVLGIFGSQIFLLKQISSRMSRRAH